ncbi:hypothetical protein KY361_00360 [Candidatus Woesearchaeota archaeon]|nr:hypothetical protein [Candidatus Woesearchaeota archaeon]
MKVSLCGGDKCCPAVEVGRDSVKIGERGNMCVLKKKEWDTLKEKVIKGEI